MIMEEKKIRKRWNDHAIVPIFAMLLLMFLGQLLGNVLEFFPALYPNDPALTALFYLTFIGIWVVVLLYLSVTKRNRPILKTLWTKPSGNNWQLLLFGFGLGFALNAFCALIAWLNGDIKLTYDSFQPLWLLYVFAAVFVQSSAEELLCRGFLYQRLRRGYKHPAVAIVGNSVVFGFLHLMNDGVTFLSVLNIVAVGILFSFMVYYLDSIWCAMAMHTTWNFTQNIIFGLPNSGIVVPFSIFKLDAATATDSFAYNVGFGIEGTILANAVLIAACIALYFWGKKHPKEPIDIWTETV